MRYADIDLDALVANLHELRERFPVEYVIAVLKADAYGHGAVHCARAALAAGADMLGLADLDEAIELRAAGIEAPLLAWLHSDDTDFRPAIELGISIGVSSIGILERVIAEAARIERTALVHLKAETGLSRGGVRESSWAELLALAARAEAEGRIQVEGLFSHLANASIESNRAQGVRFDAFVEMAGGLGIRPKYCHIAASAATLTDPALRFNAVRLGITLYGLTPTHAAEPASMWGLRPVMSLRSKVVLLSDLSAGSGVSYGLEWVAPRDTRVVLVPFGYADGLPRSAGGQAEVAIAGVRYPVRGRIAMDQIVVEIGDAPVAVGAEVTLWGDPAEGAPSADEWAAWAGTIGYELVTKVGRRVTYRYTGAGA